MDATQIGMYLGAVVGLTELAKFSRYVPDRHGLLVAAVFSALAVVLHCVQYGFHRDLTVQYFFAWTTILFGAAGVYGFVREVRSGDVMNAQRNSVDGTGKIIR